MEVAASAASSDNSFITLLGLTGLALLVAGGLVGGILLYWKHFAAWYRNRDRHKDSANTVLLQITVPKDNEIKIDAAEQMISALYSIKKSTGRFNLKRQAQVAFEIVALHESVRFY